MLPLWSSRNKLNLWMFALILKLLLHEPMIRAVIWRRRHLGCWIICAQGWIRSVWSHPLWTLWRLQTWPDSESVSLSRDIASLCADIFVRGKYQRAGQGWRIVLFAFMGSCECHWMLVLWDEWRSISPCASMFSSLWPNSVDKWRWSQTIRQMMQGVWYSSTDVPLEYCESYQHNDE